MCIIIVIQYFAAIGRNVVEIWRFFDFFPKWQPSDIVDLLYACVNHHDEWAIFGGRCHCAKFGSNQCSSYANTRFNILRVKLKMRSHTRKRWGFGVLHSQYGKQYQCDPKTALPCAETYTSLMYVNGCDYRFPYSFQQDGFCLLCENAKATPKN